MFVVFFSKLLIYIKSWFALIFFTVFYTVSRFDIHAIKYEINVSTKKGAAALIMVCYPSRGQ